MRMPLMIIVLGFAGLVPFVVGPAWMALLPEHAPYWLDQAWLMYVTLVAAFLAGSFWGFSLMASMGPEGKVGILLATVLLGMTWVSLMMSPPYSLYCLAANFVVLLIADYWRGRTLDDIPGYFAFRSLLTVGALMAIGGRLLLPL